MWYLSVKAGHSDLVLCVLGVGDGKVHAQIEVQRSGACEKQNTCTYIWG